MQNIEVQLEGYPEFWKSGQHLVDLEVTIGQNEKSSNCMILLSDPLGLIAAALVNHTIAAGGIPQLPSNSTTPQAATATTITPQVTSTTPFTSGVISRGTDFTPQRMAFLDTLALKEVGGYFNGQFSETWYYTRYSNGVTYATFSKEEAAKGFPVSAGNKASGRYQFLRTTYEYLQRKYGGLPDFTPQSQDKAAIIYLKERGAIGLIDAGNFEGAVAKLRTAWTSLPGAKEQPAGWTMDKAKAYYLERLRYYHGAVTSTPQTTKVTPEAQSVTNLRPDIPEPTKEPIKGSKITINWGEVSFEFFHQGTEHTSDGTTRVLGQGVRWVLNRRKRNKTVKNATLKQLAEAIAVAHGIKLDWQATYDPSYDHIDQSGISDYQLLVREANFAGLWVSEEPGKLVVKSRDKIRDSGYYIQRGVNLIKYQISDKALDPNNTEASSLLQEEPKATVEPTTGQLKQTNIDVDPAKDKSTTGQPQKPIAGTPTPGQDAILQQSRARFKRIKGLPSTFVTVLDANTLTLKPLDAVRTLDFPEPFNRIWMIDSVTHKASANTTTLNTYSPVEVIDNTPETTPAPQTQTAPPPNTPGTWVYPSTGIVGSPYGMRVHPIHGNRRMHNGQDIAGSGSSVVSVSDGIVSGAKYEGGYGNTVRIKHDNGFSTLYAHLRSMSVRLGQRVTKGQQIGIEGTTGGSTGVHLHFEITEPSGARVDPAKYFPKMGAKNRGVSITAGSPVI